MSMPPFTGGSDAASTSAIIESRLHMNEHDDDVASEVGEGEVEMDEYPILDDEDEDDDEDGDGVEDEEEEPEGDTDASEL
jgi:hypothetical protein